MDKNKCNHDSTSYAFLVDSIEEKVTDMSKRISIDDFLENHKIQCDVKEKKKYLKCKNGHLLTKYKSDIITSHFNHKAFNHENKNISFESEWHLDWKKYFDKTEVVIPKNDKMHKERQADAVIGNKTFEFQHSEYSKCEINERSNDHKNGGYKINWILDCSDDTLSVIKCNGSLLVKFLKNDWKYKNFVNLDFIYLDYGDMIFRVPPKKINGGMIYVAESKNKLDFIKSLKEDSEKWKDDNIPQCTLYVCQRGAGCGKTFEAVQLPNTNNDLFIEKKQFIYLTKMKSARDVIKQELVEQIRDKKLNNIKDITVNDDNDIDMCGNQYKLSYTNKIGTKCKILIGTIDAFMWRLGNHDNNESDYFYGIRKSVKDGYFDGNNEIMFAGTLVKFNKETVIIIDEAQDLPPDYIQCIERIMMTTHFDTYIVGDKLQSIWDENNVLTYLETHTFSYPIEIKRDNRENKVRRFHNEKFISFVNSMIPFKEYELPEITSICDGKNCKYIHNSEKDPIVKFQIPRIYASRDDEDDNGNYEINNLCNIDNTVNKIMEYVEYEVTTHNYLPKNFMFIFPYLKKNELATKLESGLQSFWISKFNNKKYVTDVVMHDLFWKKEFNENKYFQFVFFHKSNEGESINLNDSENSTRILSIHSSKGSGREVVFLLGLNEKILRRYTNITGSLQYNSLIHVAITRQKIKLYIGLENDGGEIWHRFYDDDLKIDDNIKPTLPNIKCNIGANEINRLNLCDHFEEINEIFHITRKSTKILDRPPEYNKKIVDWGHHIIRNAVFRYTFLTFIFNNETYCEYGVQFRSIITKICNLPVKLLLNSEYYKQLDKFRSHEGKQQNKTPIPVLYFDSYKGAKYYLIKDYIVEIIQSIQKKIKRQLANNKIPQLCPIECVIMWHIIDIEKNGKFADTGIMDIYNILYYYDECYSPENENHDSFGCICKKLFTNHNNNASDNKMNKNNNIFISIKNHYEKIGQIEKMYNFYKTYITEQYGGKFKYNIQHCVTARGKVSSELGIRDNFWLIANSESYVINFIFKPQLNKLNFNETYIDMINDTYLIQNCANEKNIGRFGDKKIINCILTLEMDPLFFDHIGELLEKNKNNYHNILNKSVVTLFCEQNNEMFKYYSYYINHKPTDCNNGIVNVIKNLKLDYNKRNERGKKIPHYICDFIENININMTQDNKEKYIKMFSSEKNFNTEFTKTIIKYVDTEFPNCVSDKEFITF